MIRRLLFIAAEILAAFVIIVAGVLFWAARYVDTEEFRNRFANVLEQVVGVPVALEGELNIALYPTLSLEIIDLELKGSSDSGGRPLVALDTVRVSVRLLPLLSNQVEIRSIVVEGMDVNVIRSKDDTINWQLVLDRQDVASSLVSGEEPVVAVSLAELDVTDASVSYVDEKDGQTFGLSGINLRTGAIVPGEVVPFTAKSRFEWKEGDVTSEFVLKGIVETGNGRGVLLRDATLYASIGGAFLPVGASPGEMVARVVMDSGKRSISLDGLRVRFLGLSAEGAFESGDLSKELAGNGRLKVNRFRPADVIGRYFPKAPVKSVKGLEKGELEADFKFDESGVSVTKLKAALDDLPVSGSISMSNYRHPRFSFELDGGTVDLDRYLPLFRTDTPFIWDDFALPFFRSIRAKGVVRAKSFKVLDIPISDVRLNVTADGKSISADGTAVRNNDVSVSAKAAFRIGRNGAGVPTFGSDLEFVLQSSEGGFDFFNVHPVAMTGASRISGTLNVATMDCPPKEESIGILRHVSGEVGVGFGPGHGGYSPENGEPFSLTYSKSEGVFKWKPVSAEGERFTFKIDANLHTAGDPKYQAAGLAVFGPLTWGVDGNVLKSPGLSVKGSVHGSLYTDLPARLAVSGKVGFDTTKAEASVADATIRTLETTVKGTALFTDLDKAFKGTGTLEVPGANIRRIVYLLNKFTFRTKDTEALKQAVLKTQFKVDEDGFRLDELEGSLDGMPFSGHIVGQGFLEPKLVFSLEGGNLDIDRFIPPSSKPSLEEQRAGKIHKAPPVDLPLGFLRWLNATGKARFEEFKLAKVRVKGFSGNLKAVKGAINIFDVKGMVHGGIFKAGWVAEVGKKSMTTHLKLHIEDMQAGPLLMDMADKEYVRGEADVDIDVKSSGATDDDIVKNLNGKTWCRINNGSFKFTGYDRTVKADDRINDRMNLVHQSDSRDRRTTFHKAMGYFTVKQGVFTVDKFRVEAPPLLQSYGRGSFSLPDNTIDLAIRNDFVAVPSVTIMMTGKLSDPNVSVPTGKIVNETVRNILSLPEKSFKFLRDLFQ